MPDPVPSATGAFDFVARAVRALLVPAVMQAGRALAAFGRVAGPAGLDKGWWLCVAGAGAAASRAQAPRLRLLPHGGAAG